MDSPEKHGGGPRQFLGYMGIGLQLAVTVLIFVIGGYELDTYLDRSPLFVSLGAFLGMGLGFYHLIKQLQHIEKISKESENRKRNRWM